MSEDAPPPTLRVLATGDGWTALSKPSGLACHRSAWCHDDVTVHSLAGALLGRPIHLVHRLDRAASGVLFVGHDGPTAGRLHAALKDPATVKVYWAFVRGFFRWDDPFVVDAPMTDDQGIMRDARSRVSLLGRSVEPRCSLLRVETETGRYHQVRRHVRDLGHPILMDHAHGDTRLNTEWRGRGLHRLGLHCARITMPWEGGVIDVACPPPADLATVWRAMPWWDEAAREAPELAAPPEPAGPADDRAAAP